MYSDRISTLLLDSKQLRLIAKPYTRCILISACSSRPLKSGDIVALVLIPGIGYWGWRPRLFIRNRLLWRGRTQGSPRKTTQSSHGPRFNPRRHNLWHKSPNQPHNDQNQENSNSGHIYNNCVGFIQNYQHFVWSPNFPFWFSPNQNLGENVTESKEMTDPVCLWCRESHQFGERCKCYPLSELFNATVCQKLKHQVWQPHPEDRI